MRLRVLVPVLVPAPRWDLLRFSRASTKTFTEPASERPASSSDLLLSRLELCRLATTVPFVSFFFAWINAVLYPASLIPIFQLAARTRTWRPRLPKMAAVSHLNPSPVSLRWVSLQEAAGDSS